MAETDDSMVEEHPQDPEAAAGKPTANPYPGLLGRQLLTPTAPLVPGAAIRVAPPVLSPLPRTSPPRWAEDPSGRHQWRWWTGATWSEHVADDGESAVDPIE